MPNFTFVIIHNSLSIKKLQNFAHAGLLTHLWAVYYYFSFFQHCIRAFYSWLLYWRWFIFVQLNTLHDTIKFTCSYDLANRSTTFLDTTVRNTDNAIETDLFWKPIDRVQYLLPSLCHPAHTFKSTPYTLYLQRTHTSLFTGSNNPDTWMHIFRLPLYMSPPCQFYNTGFIHFKPSFYLGSSTEQRSSLMQNNI